MQVSAEHQPDSQCTVSLLPAAVNPPVARNGCEQPEMAVQTALGWRPFHVTEPKHLSMQVSAGHEPGCDVGPVISKESKKRVEDLIASGMQQVSLLHLQ